MAETDTTLHITNPEQKKPEPLTTESVSRWAADTAVGFMALDMTPRIVSGLTGEQQKPETQKALLDQQAAVVNHILHLQSALLLHIQQGKDVSDFSYSFADSHAFAGGTFNISEAAVLGTLKNTLTHYNTVKAGQVASSAERTPAAATPEPGKADLRVEPSSLAGLNIIVSRDAQGAAVKLTIAGEKATNSAVQSLMPAVSENSDTVLRPAEQKLSEIKAGQDDARARLEAVIAKLK